MKDLTQSSPYSYKHTDEKYAKQLKRMLELYRLPHKICKENRKMPKKITEMGEIFLDNDTLRPGVIKKIWPRTWQRPSI